MSGLAILHDCDTWRATYGRLHRPSVMARFDTVSAAALLEEGGRAEAAVLEQEGALLFHPYVRRPCPYDAALTDLVSPYEFGGFWFSTDDAERRRRLVAAFEPAFQAHAEAQGTVSEFIRFHPHGGGADLDWQSYDVLPAQEHVVAPLDGGYEAAHAAIVKNKRRDIRQAQRAGLSVAFDAEIPSFVAMYHANLDRLGAEPFYYFPERHFAALAETLLFIRVCDSTGAPCAIHAWLRDGETMLFYLAASVEERRDVLPNDFAIDAAMRYGAERGCRRLHLGGGAPSLYWFKARFSEARVRYSVGRRTFLPAAYETLAARRGAGSSPRYFPAYRG